MKNEVYCFFLASHTSIWAQPNDAGVNKRFHWCMEQIVKTKRRKTSVPNVCYFNTAITKAVVEFREKERTELINNGENATTNAYKRTGIVSFDPFATAWVDDIATLGALNSKDETPTSYEPLLKLPLPTLTPSEK